MEKDKIINGDETMKVYGWVLYLWDNEITSKSWVSVGKPIYLHHNHYRLMDIEGQIIEVSTCHTFELEPITTEDRWNELTGL